MHQYRKNDTRALEKNIIILNTYIILYCFLETFECGMYLVLWCTISVISESVP